MIDTKATQAISTATIDRLRGTKSIPTIIAIARPIQEMRTSVTKSIEIQRSIANERITINGRLTKKFIAKVIASIAEYRPGEFIVAHGLNPNGTGKPAVHICAEYNHIPSQAGGEMY
jgi:predicted phage tail protein